MLGRLIQGLGIGGQTVALYVVVARVYPTAIHGRVFAAFSAAWVVPSLIGPFLAGAVAEYLHWRWVFLGVATADRRRVHDGRAAACAASRCTPTNPRPAASRPLACAVAVAVGALGLSLAGELGTGRGSRSRHPSSSSDSRRPLLPPRTLRAGAGCRASC